MQQRDETHSILMGYLLWIFGFLGAHRFYYGKPVTGTIWLFTLGLLLIGWILDLFLIPGMSRRADIKFQRSSVSYNVAWILLTFLGIFGIHRFYMGKWITGLIWLLTGGLFLVGYIYDYWTLNDQIDELSAREAPSGPAPLMRARRHAHERRPGSRLGAGGEQRGQVTSARRPSSRPPPW